MRPRLPSGLDPAVRAGGLAAAMTTVGLLEAMFVVGRERPAVFAMVLALTVSLAWCRTHPATAAVVVTAAFAAQLPWAGVRLFDQTFTGFVCILVASYALGRHGSRRTLLPVSGVCALTAASTIGLYDASVASGVLAVALVLTPVAVGSMVRGRVRLRDALGAQAAELDAAAEVAAAADAVRVRSRIAVEVQDVVSRRVDEMVIHGNLARRLATTDPARAAETAGRVEAGGREALHEMRRMLGVLRDGDEPADLEPAPGRRLIDDPADDSATVAAHGWQPTEPVPGSDVRRRGPLTAQARRADSWLTSALVVVTAGESLILSLQDGGSGAAAAALGALVAAPLLLRRSLPLRASATGLAAACATAAFTALPTFSLTLVVPLYAYATGAYTGARTERTGLVLVLAGVVSMNLLTGTARAGDYVFPALLAGLAWLAGRTVREQTRLTTKMAERARHLEHLRAMRAATATTEERLRLARELHDVVAHTMMVMVVQAGGARRALESGHAGADEALGVVADTGRNATAELRRLLALVDPARPAQPTGAGLTQVGALVERGRAAGLSVDLRVDGEPRSLAGGLELAAYRIVQEALTNVLRHADATRVTVTVAYRDDQLVLEVRDDGRATPGASTERAGNGIEGMCERVRIYRGELRAGPLPGGGFLVAATLPYSPVVAEQPV